MANFSFKIKFESNYVHTLMLALYVSDIIQNTNSPEDRELNSWGYRVHKKTERGQVQLRRMAGFV